MDDSTKTRLIRLLFEQKKILKHRKPGRNQKALEKNFEMTSLFGPPKLTWLQNLGQLFNKQN